VLVACDLRAGFVFGCEGWEMHDARFATTHLSLKFLDIKNKMN
jgi:hypothetical protein